MNKKVALIMSPSIFLADEKIFPFLGILKVAAAWEQQGQKIDVIDLSGIENYLDVLNEYFSLNKDIEFVGLTATTPQMKNTFEIAKFMKANWGHKLVLGGAHVTLMHTASKREKLRGEFSRSCRDVEKLKDHFDVLVCGDGELTLDLIKQMDKGVIDGDDRMSPLFLTNQKFTDLPNPARHLIDLDSYHYHIEGERATSMITQLGCSFKCSFCFTADTLITKSDGSKEKIQNIRLHDELIGFDESSGELFKTTVKRLLKSLTKELLHIYTEDGKKISTTREHPFLLNSSLGFFWQEAQDLSLSDKLINIDKKEVGIVKIEKETLNEEVEVYNFSCDPYESYIADDIIVHNCSGRNSPSLRKVRNRSVDSILGELEFIHKTYGYKAMMLYDDELNLTKQIHELMNGISDLSDKLGIDFKLRGFTKSELFNDQQAKDMYRAGFRVLLTGFESGHERVLRNIQKNATLEDNTRCIETANRNGLKQKALMSLGHPFDGPETARAMADWLLKVGVFDFDVSAISVFPGSLYWDEAIYDKDKDLYVYTSPKTGDKLYQKNIDFTKEANFYKGEPGSYESFVFTDYMTAEELVQIRDEVEAEVRSKLNIPYNASSPAKKFEHSMGTAVVLPDNILRSTDTHKAPQVESSLDVPKSNPKSLKVIS